MGHGALKERPRRWLGHHAGVGPRHPREQLEHLLGGRGVGDADGQIDAAHPIGERPVDHPLADQRRVRHDDLGSLPSAHRARAHADARHLSGEVAELDGIADLAGQVTRIGMRSSTVRAPNWMESAILRGSWVKRMSPETKLLTMPCRRKPTPTRNAPARIVTRVRSTPRIVTPNRKPTKSVA